LRDRAGVAPRAEEDEGDRADEAQREGGRDETQPPRREERGEPPDGRGRRARVGRGRDGRALLGLARRARQADGQAATLVAVCEVRDGPEPRGLGQRVLGVGAQLVGVEMRRRLCVARRARAPARRAEAAAEQGVNLFVELCLHREP
jgi:hypothetical protein